MITLPTSLELREAVKTIVDEVANVGTVVDDPEWQQDARQYVKQVQEHGIVLEDGGDTPSAPGGLFEAQYTINFHFFWSFNKPAPAGKTRKQAFAEVWRDLKVKFHNEPRLRLVGNGYTVLHGGLGNPGGQLREQFDIGMTYYAPGALVVGISSC